MKSQLKQSGAERRNRKLPHFLDFNQRRAGGCVPRRFDLSRGGVEVQREQHRRVVAASGQKRGPGLNRRGDSHVVG